MKNVEDIFSLSPMQEFMIIGAVTDNRTDAMFEQFCYRIEQQLDVTAFKQAWQDLVDYHPALRTAFVWENVSAPVQVVKKEASVSVDVINWQTFSSAEQRLQLNELIERDAAKGLDITKAPLLRITLAILNPNEAFMLWSGHHLIGDRWSLPTVFRDLGRFYASRVLGQQANLPAAVPYKRYIEWIKQQNQPKAIQYWRETLEGFNKPTQLTNFVRGSNSALATKLSRSLGPEVFKTLQSYASRINATMNNVANAAWGLVLQNIHKTDDVLFGTAVSGRPVSLSNVDDIVGCFISNVPVRIKFSAESSVEEYISQVRTKGLVQSEFEYFSPLLIARANGVTSGVCVFDHILVWLSPYQVDLNQAFNFTPVDHSLSTGYPLSVMIEERHDDLELSLHLHPDYESKIPLEDLADLFFEILTDLISVVGSTSVHDLAQFEPCLNPVTQPEVLVLLDIPNDPSTLTEQLGREKITPEEVKEMLLTHWKQLLEIDEFYEDSSFFDCGGTSLLAATLHGRIETSLRSRIPLISLFANPTLSGMEKTILNGDWQLQNGWYFEIQRGKSLMPLICVATPEVNTLGYSIFSEHISANRPVILLQAPPDSKEVRRYSPNELKQMSRSYVDALKKIQPQGPYALIGFCDGAHLVVEMAANFEEQSERVAFVGVVDTWGYFTVSKRIKFHKVYKKLEYYGRRIKRLTKLGFRDASAEVFQALGLLSKKNLMSGEVNNDLGDTGVAANIPDRRIVTEEWEGEFGDPANAPKEPKFRGQISLFRNPKSPWWRVRDPLMGWGLQATHVVVETLPKARHDTLFREPIVGELGRRVEAHLSDN